MLYYITGGLQVSDGRGKSWIVPEHAIHQDFVFHVDKLIDYTGMSADLIPEFVSVNHTDEQVINFIQRLLEFTPRNQKEKDFVNSKIVEFRRRFCDTTIPTPSFVWKLHE